MKKLLIFVLALGLLISATGMAMALDKDKASLTFAHNQKDIVWVSMSKVNPFDVIEENDVINGYKQWGYLAKMHVNSGAQYMVGADLTALKVPTNYQIVKGDHTQFLNSSTYNTPEKQFEHRMVIRTRKNTTRPLAACVLDTQLINSAEDYYDNGGN